MVITMAKLCMAHASTHGARKPPGPIIQGLGLAQNLVTHTYHTLIQIDTNTNTNVRLFIIYKYKNEQIQNHKFTAAE